MATPKKPLAGKTFKMPTQQLDSITLLKSAAKFVSKFHANPSRLVLHFEINLNLVGRNNFYLIGYLWAYRGKKVQAIKTELPVVKGKNVSLQLPADRIALGNMSLPWSRVKKMAKANPILTFTPRLYPNPHIAYDVNGFDLNPSPPAQP